MHADAPALLLYEPAVHARHVDSDSALGTELDVPEGHGTHCVWAVLAYVPAPQPVHDTATATWPGAGLTLPGEHTIHAAADVALWVAENVPGPH